MSLRSCGLPLVERVTRAAYGPDWIALCALDQRLAQSSDVHVDGAFVDKLVSAPDGVEELPARVYAPWPFHQEFENAEFGGAELDRPACARNAPFLTIHFEIAE